MRPTRSRPAAMLISLACLGLAVCLAGRARADAVSQVVIDAEQDATNGDPNPATFRQTFNVTGDTIQSVSITTPNNRSLTLNPDNQNGGGQSSSWSYDSSNYASYGSATALRQDYPTGDYKLSIQYIDNYTDTVTLAFNPTQPNGFAQIRYPSANATDVPGGTSPTFTWWPVTGNDNSLLHGELHESDTYGSHNVAEYGPVGASTTSWQLPVTLDPSAQYDFRLGIFNADPDPMAAYYTDKDTDKIHPFTYYGVFGNVNHTPFSTTTAVPEPGTLLLLAAGVAAWWLRRRLPHRSA